MTLKQLEFLREIVRQSLSISDAAAALGTSQPGVSRQIQLLERELGLPMLVRRRNRVVALTEAGSLVLAAAGHLLDEAENIRQIAAEARRDGGRLIVATSHLHARYTLLKPFQRLRATHPEVELLLLQSQPNEIPRLVESGAAHIGVSTGGEAEIVQMCPGLTVLTGEVLRRSAIVPTGHPLARRRRLSLAEIAANPLIGYNSQTQMGRQLATAFAAEGISAHYVVRASDSDVIKAYVVRGLGVGIVPTIAVVGTERTGLAVIDVTGLLDEVRAVITLRRDMYLRRHVIDFIRVIAPAWDGRAIQAAMAGAA